MPASDDLETGGVERVLERSRPLPRSAFRGELRRRLSERDPARPRRIGYLIAAYGGSGALLLLLAAAGVAGLGPLSA